jgi:L-lactate dehydrogenase complex protein LldG
MTARGEILARIRGALASTMPGAALPPDAAPARGDDVLPGYRTSTDLATPQLLDLLTERLHDYGSTVRRTAPDQVGVAVGDALGHRGATRIVVPPGLDLTGLTGSSGLAADIEIIVDDGLSPAALDAVDGVITAAAVAIAETGTIVLDGSPGQGRRALSLVPDYHLCILQAGQVVGLVPEALARLIPGRPLTWISGPSATSDIELDRVQGVHGPRTLEVILISRRQGERGDASRIGHLRRR